MSPENNDLDRILSDIRDETPDPEVIDAAAARVRARLPHTALRSCADFQALMPEYRAGRLSEARALLLKDHTHECVACRKALEGAKVVAFSAPRRVTAAPWFRWAMAAGVAAVAMLAGWGVYNTVLTGGGHTVVQAASGSVYRVSGDAAERLAAGAELPGAAEVRTARDSGAVVRLPDSSLVEMRERSAFSVSAAGRDLTVRLTRGSIIVQAAKRRSGHLYVATRDCRVAVTGTVFSVNSGVKGSRVSVIEGEVRVAQDGQEKVLHPGEQYASSPSITTVPVRDEIAWSRNFDQHVALLGEFAALRRQLEQVRMPDARYHSRILGMLPADTVVYAAIPNLGRTLGEAQQILRQRVDQSPVLRQWWDEKLDRGGAFDKAVAELRQLSEYLGEEIVIAAPVSPEGKPGSPVVLSEVRRTGMAEYIKSQPLFQNGSHLRIANSPDALGPVKHGEAVLYLGSDIAAISPDAAALRKVLAGTGGFAGTALGARVAESYRDGASFVFAADLEKLIATSAPARHHEDRPGFDQLKYALLEQRQTGGATDTHAVLAFRGPRKGVAAWLGKPAPIGALDYVSADANLASAFTIKNPAAIFDEMFSTPEARDGLARMEAELGINVRDDLLASLGGEIVVALDGPALPVPSWKLVAEVYDPARLQTTIQRILEAYNRKAPEHGKSPAQLTHEAVSGRTWYRLVIPGAGQYGEADYTFIDGYLIAAPSRALVERAINYRATGYTLTRSAAFSKLLPRDRYADFSAMYYQNIGGALGSLADLVNPGKGALSPEQKKSLEAAAAEFGKPMLVTFYGEEDRITLASTGSMLALNPANLLRMASPGAMLSSLHGPRTAARRTRN